MAEESTLISHNRQTMTATATETPLVSVVVCTRNRGESIVSTLETLLANDYANFEVVVVDQSTDDLTEQVMPRFLKDKRLRYFRSTTKGLGRARNIGMGKA